MKEKFNSLSPIRQALSLFGIGVAATILLSMIISVVLSHFYPEMVQLPIEEQVKNYPIPFMMTTFIPIQVGLLLTPSLIYLFLEDKSQSRKRKTSFIWSVWAILLFFVAFFLLPFIGEINIQFTKWFGLYDSLIASKEASDTQMTSLIGEYGSKSFIFSVLIIGVLTGIAEELLFRRFLFHHMLKDTNRLGLSLVSSAFIFALLHFNYIQILPLFTFGIAFGLMYYASGSIWPGIVCHALNNILNVYWLSTDTFPVWMEGIDLKITIPSTFLLMGLLLYFYKRKYS